MEFLFSYKKVIRLNLTVRLNKNITVSIQMFYRQVFLRLVYFIS